MAAQSRVYRLSRWKQWRYSLRIWLPTSFFMLLFASLYVFVYFIAPSREVADVRGAATHYGSGRISAVSYIPPTKSGVNPSVLVSLEVAGGTAIFRTQDDLHKGEPVQVTYRVGRSGRIHIDDVKPEGKAKP